MIDAILFGLFLGLLFGGIVGYVIGGTVSVRPWKKMVADWRAAYREDTRR
jgi:hypothetical protein